MKHIVLALLLGGTLNVKAQTQLTLQQCIDYTLKSHPSIRINENNVRIAKEKSRQAVADYLPQVSGSVTMLDNMRLQTTVLPAGIFGPDPAEVQFGTKYNTNATIDVSQALFDQSKIAGIQANKPYAEMTALQKQQNDETLVYNTAKAYFQVLIYQEQLRLLYANREKYEEMVSVLQHQYEKGTALEKDVDRVKVNLNTTIYQIEDATTKEQLAVNALKNAMGMPMDEELIVEADMDYELLVNSDTQDGLKLEALTEYQLNEKSIDLQEISVKASKAAYLPTLNAVGKFGTQALSNDFSQAFDRWNSFSYVGLSLKVPLFSGLKRKSIVSEEKFKLNNERANFDLNKQNLQLAFENAKTSVGTAYANYRSNKDNMLLAEKLLAVTDYQYQRGVVSLTDYLNDDAAYKGAQSNYVSSLYQLMISRLDYQKSIGELDEFISQIK